LVKLPDDPYLLSDLSALLIEKGRLNSDPYSFFRAIFSSDKALAIDPFLPEAQFNLGLALGHLFLEGEACKAWDRYLRIDNESEWANEALARCHRSKPRSVGWESAVEQIDSAVRSENQDMVAEVVHKFHRSARLYAEKELIEGWAGTVNSGLEIGTEHHLKIAQAIGDALEKHSGDQMISRLIASTISAASYKRVELLQGYAAYSEGLRLSERDLDDQALARFEEAAVYLSRIQSPLFYRAELKAATCLFYMGKPDLSLARLIDLSSRFKPNQYPTLMGEVLWIQGLSYSKLADFPAAFRVYNAAQKLFVATDEKENVAFINFLLAENLRYQGQPRRALLFLSEALKTIGTMGMSRWYHNSLLDGAEIALKEGLPEVALHFQNEMIEESLRGRDPITIAESLLRRARTFVKLGTARAAILDIDNAQRWATRVESKVRRGNLEADIAMISSDLKCAQQDTAGAVSLLASAIQEAKVHGRVFRLPDLFEAEGYAYLAAGRSNLAEQSFRSALDELILQRRNLAEYDLRASYFERSQKLFDALMRIELRQNKSAETFSLAEEAKSRTLLDVLHAAPLSQSGIRNELPQKTAILEYVIMEDRLLIFVLSRERFRLIEVPIAEDVLRAEVQAFAKTIRALDKTNEKKLAKNLHRLLILPALPLIKDAKYLVLVPSQFLCAMPYAALVNPSTNRYLIEDVSIAFSPSATSFIFLSKIERRLRRKPVGKILVVSDPSFDRSQFPNLIRLEGAKAEGFALRSLGGVKVLAGNSATPKKFSLLAPRYSTVHVAAHLRLNNQLASQSALILAPEVASQLGQAGAGLLLARDVYRLKFSKTRLVVLAACNGAEGPISRGEGSDSLERAFVGAGVPTVVASLWEVSDSSAVEFFIRFHQRIREGESVPGALRSAQLSFLHDSAEAKSSSSLWAGFRAFGGFSF
jgi:CHAT domain-containing protein